MDKRRSGFQAALSFCLTNRINSSKIEKHMRYRKRKGNHGNHKSKQADF